MLFAASGFFLVVVFALFFGDTVASEAQWGSLRYTLATPVPRMRLLRQKWYAALVLSVGAFLTLVVVAVVAGGHRLRVRRRSTTPVGLSIAQGDGAAAAGRDGRLPRRPPARRRRAGVLALDDHRRAAGRGRRRGVHDDRVRDPRAGRRSWARSATSSRRRTGVAWTDLLQTPVDSGDLFRGVIQSLIYVAVLTALGFRHFARRDVTS